MPPWHNYVNGRQSGQIPLYPLDMRKNLYFIGESNYEFNKFNTNRSNTAAGTGHHRLRKMNIKEKDNLKNQLAEMASDQEIRKKSHKINEEFSVAESDGLEVF